MAKTAVYDLIDKYIVQARLLTPLHVGSADKGTGEVLVHPVTNMPFIQASGIAGVFRTCYRDLFEDPASELTLFGDNDKNAGRIRFTDGRIFGENAFIKTELRPRIRINRKTGTSDTAKGNGRDNVSGQKFETEYIGAGAEIEFTVFIYSEQNALEDNQKRIEQVFAQIHTRGSRGVSNNKDGAHPSCEARNDREMSWRGGAVQFGGQKSNGCGLMELLSLRHHAFNMLEKEGRSDWTKEGNEDSLVYEDRLDAVERLQEQNLFSTRAYTILLEAQTEGALLVKAIALTEENRIDGKNNGKKEALDSKTDSKKKSEKETEPDSVNMRNSQGHYIIPGSSVKGAVRAQFERIAAYLEDNSHRKNDYPLDNDQKGFSRKTVIEEAFGRPGEKDETGAAGNIRFYDVLVSPINGHEKEVTYNRIHIDRFTGGVMNTGLFKEQAVHGNLLIEAAVMMNVHHIDHEPYEIEAERKQRELEENVVMTEEEKTSAKDTIKAEKNHQIEQAVSSAKEDAKRKADRSCGMLIFALRDLALGMYNLGSGYSVGRGFLYAKKMTILTGKGKKAELVFSKTDEARGQVSMKLNDPDRIVERCLRALRDQMQNTVSSVAGKEGV